MRLEKLSPMLFTRDVRGTIEFYTERLGFTLDAVLPAGTAEPPGRPTWCSLSHGDVHVMFMAAEPDAPPPSLTGQLYVYTDDVQAVLERVAGHARVLWGPEVYDYGMRELAIADNNGYTLQFGEPTDAPADCRTSDAD